MDNGDCVIGGDLHAAKELPSIKSFELYKGGFFNENNYKEVRILCNVTVFSGEISVSFKAIDDKGYERIRTLRLKTDCPDAVYIYGADDATTVHATKITKNLEWVKDWFVPDIEYQYMEHLHDGRLCARIVPDGDAVITLQSNADDVVTCEFDWWLTLGEKAYALEVTHMLQVVTMSFCMFLACRILQGTTVEEINKLAYDAKVSVNKTSGIDNALSILGAIGK